MSFDIVNRYTAAVLYRSETADSIAQAVIEAHGKGANLRCADLDGANLTCADLRGAYLRGANLRGADLDGADLRCADLDGANLTCADLRGAYLAGADLRGADLAGADLAGVNLAGANGLLSKPVTPLQIGGSRDWIIVRQDGHITIGCEHHPLTWWEEHYRAVGRREDYSDQQVAEYADHIAACRKWMERYGVLEVITEKEAEVTK